MSTRPRPSSSSPSQPPAKHPRIELPDKPHTQPQRPEANTPESTRTLEESKEHALSYPPHDFRPSPAPAFQQPVPLLSFSYVSTPPDAVPISMPTPNADRKRVRVQRFTDASLRYLSSPPPGADLNYGYDRWLPRPESRTRLDGLLRALVRPAAAAKMGPGKRAGAVAWRGVMTKCVSPPLCVRAA